MSTLSEQPVNKSLIEDNEEKKNDQPTEKQLEMAMQFIDLMDMMKAMKEQLVNVDMKLIREYVQRYMSDDKADLVASYHEAFDSVSKTDPVRLSVLSFLGEIGITIYEKPVE